MAPRSGASARGKVPRKSQESPRKGLEKVPGKSPGKVPRKSHESPHPYGGPLYILYESYKIFIKNH